MQITCTGTGIGETPYLLHINRKCFADAERIPGAYIVRWSSMKSKIEIANALRKAYFAIHEDITDRSDQKLLENGIYELFNGSFAPTVSASSEEVVISVGSSRHIATLDAYCANDSAVDEYFRREFRNNLGSTRIVTPYCDMFIEQYGKNYTIAVMGDDRINLGKQIAQAMKTTATYEEVRTHPLLEIVITDLIERMRAQEAEA